MGPRRGLTQPQGVRSAERENHPRLRRVQESQLLHHEEQAPPPGARRVEEVLPPLQQASAPQGNQVMADVVVPPTTPENRTVAAVRGLPSFYQAVMAEMRKVTWPEIPDVRPATIAIIIFVLLLGLLIWVLDVALQGLLVRVIPSLFSGR